MPVEAEQGEPSTNAHGEGSKEDDTSTPKTKTGTMPTAADILSRPRLPPKKKLAPQEIEALEEWVKMGAPDPRTLDTVASVKARKAID